MNVLVTGGAGFIGSHLVDALVEAGHRVRVLDDLSNGLAANVHPDADLVEGAVTDAPLVEKLMQNVEIVFHQAALGSVRRSVDRPLPTDSVNIHGTLTVLDAARLAGARRLIAASSSSVYGGVAPLPTRETHAAHPKSPYAVTKYAVEQYLRVFAELYDLQTVCLRYFNVYGPRQRDDSAYAAVIPLFASALRRGERPVVHGDGHQSRDFTYVADAVAANLAAMHAPVERCSGRVYNVAGGQRTSMLELLAVMADVLGVEADPAFAPARPGDVRHSHADLTAARADLGWGPRVSLRDGLTRMLTT